MKLLICILLGLVIPIVSYPQYPTKIKDHYLSYYYNAFKEDSIKGFERKKIHKAAFVQASQTIEYIQQVTKLLQSGVDYSRQDTIIIVSLENVYYDIFGDYIPTYLKDSNSYHFKPNINYVSANIIRIKSTSWRIRQLEDDRTFKEYTKANIDYFEGYSQKYYTKLRSNFIEEYLVDISLFSIDQIVQMQTAVEHIIKYYSDDSRYTATLNNLKELKINLISKITTFGKKLNDPFATLVLYNRTIHHLYFNQLGTSEERNKFLQEYEVMNNKVYNDCRKEAIVSADNNNDTLIITQLYKCKYISKINGGIFNADYLVLEKDSYARLWNSSKIRIRQLLEKKDTDHAIEILEYVQSNYAYYDKEEFDELKCDLATIYMDMAKASIYTNRNYKQGSEEAELSLKICQYQQEDYSALQAYIDNHPLIFYIAYEGLESDRLAKSITSELKTEGYMVTYDKYTPNITYSVNVVTVMIDQPEPVINSTYKTYYIREECNIQKKEADGRITTSKGYLATEPIQLETIKSTRINKYTFEITFTKVYKEKTEIFSKEYTKKYSDTYKACSLSSSIPGTTKLNSTKIVNCDSVWRVIGDDAGSLLFPNKSNPSDNELESQKSMLLKAVSNISRSAVDDISSNIL